MTTDQIERVFGRGRLKMVTGEHVEVFREAVASGERRRYTKRFLNTREGDFGQWTEREWRILARLIGHGITCVPDVVQFDRGRIGGMRIVQTYDAGVTVDQWATLLPVMRDGSVRLHVFEDCAHWWALAHHCLLALNEIHRLELVHLDIKGDNVCIPYTPANFDPDSDELALRPLFTQFALIDFAFALVSKESLTTPLPIGWQKEYDYQSPRLLAALETGRNGDLQLTRELDWRCDMYSVAAMLERYLPEASLGLRREEASGWTEERYEAAQALILRIRDAHDAELPARWPHAELLEITGARLREAELASSLERGWELARGLMVSAHAAAPLTPVTRVAPITRIASPIQVARSGRVTAVTVVVGSEASRIASQATSPLPLPRVLAGRNKRVHALVALLAMVALGAIAALLWYPDDRTGVSKDIDPFIARMQPTNPTAMETALPKLAPASKTESRPAEPPAERALLTPSQMTARAAPPTPITAAHPLPPLASFGEPAHATIRDRTPVPAPGGATYGPAKPAANVSRSANLHPSLPMSTAAGEPKPSTTRAYAPWASLQPPAWVRSRNHSPGPPPSYKMQDSDTKLASMAAEAASAAPVETAASKAELARPALQSLPLVSAGSAQEASRTGSATPIATPVASDERPAASRSIPGPTLFGARSAAPVEDRSEKLSLAAAPATIERGFRAGAGEPPQADEPGARAQRMIADTVPRIARQGELEVSRVLLIAASAYRPAQDHGVAEAARATRIRDEGSLPAGTVAQGESRRLHDKARAAFVSNRNVHTALDLELRAFAANPRDPEIAGYLAVLYLKTTPPQPELARQVALVALTARSPQYSTSRLEDWYTFAVASALAGREVDARNALFVALALSANVERTCMAGWNALVSYGDRLRGPVDAMLYRVYTRGRSIDSPWCAWPPDWSAPPRLARTD